MAQLPAQDIALKTGGTARLRIAQPDDAAAIIHIRRMTIAEGGFTQASDGEGLRTPEEEMDYIQTLLDHPNYLFLVTETSAGVVGFLEFINGQYRRTEHTGMFSMFLLPDWRHQGLGKTLLKTMLDWATAHEVLEKISLAVVSSNRPAIQLYRSFSFKQEGCCPRDLKIGPNQYVDTLLMYRYVKPGLEPRRQRL
jgi:RimJ/RimL family protein N-acetyltransferase